MKETSTHHKNLKLMGNHFQISAVADDEGWAHQCIDAAILEIQRIEKLLTTFNEESETALINRNAGIRPVVVSRETFQLIERSIRISRITQGAFDITYGSVDKGLWNFDTHLHSLPDKETAKKMARLIDYRNIMLDDAHCTVMLKKEGMRIGFGGIKRLCCRKSKICDERDGCSKRSCERSGRYDSLGITTQWEKMDDWNCRSQLQRQDFFIYEYDRLGCGYVR
jgi:thiamine biosynthesis lipoprotein